MYRAILVALDGSPRESGVLHTAAVLAQRFDAALHVCRAVTIPVGMPEGAWAISSSNLDVALLDDAHRGLARCIAAEAATVATSHARIGQPADVVIDVAEELGADLIVIGAHGYGRVERLLGTTASKIVHRATCSVLVARTDETAAPA